MWQWLLSILVPMAIHLGVDAVLARFPNLPPWLIAILKDLEGAKSLAASLPSSSGRKAAVAVARANAAAQVHMVCSGVACPPELKS